MRLPRRVPWTSSASLIQLHAHLYPATPDASLAAAERNAGLALVNLWLNRGACPAAVESTASLLRAGMLDGLLSGHGDFEGARLNYAMAIVRFVNSLVDSQQTGMYAQSIGGIAARIGLPLWFVEIRHAATHEELPSLRVLREAGAAALDWLQVHFWLPTIIALERDETSLSGPSTASTSVPTSAARSSTFFPTLSHSPLEVERERKSLRKYLAAYRTLAKAVLRDESKRGRSHAEMARLCREVEAAARMLESADVASRGVGGWGVRRSAEEEEMEDEEGSEEEVEGEATAWFGVIEALLEPGALVPLSKSKRPAWSPTHAVPSLPQPISSQWSQLLTHLSTTLPSFSDSLIDSLIRTLSAEAPPQELAAEQAQNYGKSYARTVAAWLVFLVESADAAAAGRRKKGEQDEREKEGAKAWSVARSCLRSPTEASVAVAKQLCSTRPALARKLAPLLNTLESVGLSAADIGNAPAVPTSDAMELDEKAAEPIAVDQQEAASASAPNATAVEPTTGFEDALDEMQRRLAELRADRARAQANREAASSSSSSAPADAPPSPAAAAAAAAPVSILLPSVQDVTLADEEEDAYAAILGWSRVPAAEWQSAPIGLPLPPEGLVLLPQTQGAEVVRVIP